MTKHNEDIVKEVLDTLYEAKGAILGLTALDTELEMRIKVQQNECATTRRIDRAISAIQQLEEGNSWHKASEELPPYFGDYLVIFDSNFGTDPDCSEEHECPECGETYMAHRIVLVHYETNKIVK